MKIPLNVKIDSFYPLFLLLMDKFKPVKGLMKREREVAAELMYQNYLNKDIEDTNKRNIVLFSRESRKTMYTRLGMSELSFNDYLSRLRKKDVITKDNKLKPFFNLIPGDNYEFSIKFKISE